MGLRGPQSMHDSARQRTNKTSTRSELEVLSPEDRLAIPVPELPADRLWDPKTSDWWRDAWQSPMRLEWDDADTHGLLLLAYLLDEFYIETGARSDGGSPSIRNLTALHKSIIGGARVLGLDPFARRSLQWIMIQSEAAEAGTELAKAKTAEAKAKTKSSKKRGLGGLS